MIRKNTKNKGNRIVNIIQTHKNKEFKNDGKRVGGPGWLLTPGIVKGLWATAGTATVKTGQIGIIDLSRMVVLEHSVLSRVG